jgi:ribosomal protein S28E/S33
VKILPVHHIFFAKLDEDKVRKHLRNAKHGPQEIIRIIERVKDHDGDLQAQCRVLRNQGRLINVRRVLVRLKTNDLVVQALKKWVTHWSKVEKQLEGKR